MLPIASDMAVSEEGIGVEGGRRGVARLCF